jgi:hypothetical protein
VSPVKYELSLYIPENGILRYEDGTELNGIYQFLILSDGVNLLDENLTYNEH